MALLHHCTYRTFFARWVLLWMLVENVLLWCKRLSKKSKKKKKNEKQPKRHRRPPNTLTFPSFPAQKTSLFTLLYRFFFMYINKNTFIQVILEQFFSFFCTQKLQKAPKSTIESACGDRGCGKLANPELVTSTKQLSHISLLSIGAWYTVLHVKLRCYHLVSEIKCLYNSPLIYL